MPTSTYNSDEAVDTCNIEFSYLFSYSFSLFVFKFSGMSALVETNFPDHPNSCNVFLNICYKCNNSDLIAHNLSVISIMVFKNFKSLYSLKIRNVSLILELILERTKMHQFCNLCNVASYVEFM